ncbi:sugar-binding domain-containing protein [Maritimibacter sp. UBA3975]|uniref:sugar-binding transcriptional regulator n=1 Tax=Maritimibacter sp. UBA3975 TaxID=1946833 RepID=UPI000C09385F|nr:sugar-binding domain-containing protein [Maritimibacter sp. UBA3975]MAM63376.1 DNA-binding transcriptional regulator [Maritimibacter sp.]|tara:strand:- start:104749 stop:105696 length:948 start_codon:yes stop_codon:yes gene_type:complete
MNSIDRKLDDAARAAWLSHVGGKKQDEIARIMGISRQSAQRLLSQAHAAGLVKVRIDHPIARCMGIASRLREVYGLDICEVVPSLGGARESGAAVATATGDMIERWLLSVEPVVIGLGTGRTLRAAVEHLPHLDCAQHRIVSLTGNIAPDGSTAHYNVLFTIADKVTATTYPMTMPVISATAEERAALIGQKTLETARELTQRTDVRFIGVGTIADPAPLALDGFISVTDQERLIGKGAVGEVIGWVFDAHGRLIEDTVNERVSSAPVLPGPTEPTIACAYGRDKIPAIRAAVEGRLVNGLITDEETAIALTESS